MKSIRPAFWAALMLFKAKQDILLILPCRDCELAKKTGATENTLGFLDAALEFLGALEVRPKIEIRQDAAYQRELSRRELMASVFAWGRERGKNLLEDVFWHGGNDVFLARAFLADRLDLRGEQNAAQEIVLHDGLFHDFAVSGKCDACGFCEGVCPTGAWSVRRSAEDEKGRKAELRFSMRDCVGCGLCARKCAQGAITPQTAFPWSSRPVLKGQFPLSRCRHCGAWFLNRNPERELCGRCSRHL